jgi:glycosyltransferase involved in cell wall biosynthesis
MRILMLSFYYPPDLSAGSFRARSISEALASKMKPDDTLDIVTTRPNRYATYTETAPETEQHKSIFIRRVYVPKHKSGMFDQSIAYLKYAKGAWKNTQGKNYDLVIATSSRLMTAFLGAKIAKRHNCPLYLDIRDIFTDTLKDVLAGSPLLSFLPIFRGIERYTTHSARCINLVSKGFREHFENISPQAHFTYYPNGVDEEFIEYDYTKKIASKKKVILYAGNIGEGQGLHNIIPSVAAKLHNNYEFLVIGDGGMRGELESQLKQNNVQNVSILDPVPREKLLEYYKNADYLLLHLNNYEAFKKVLPSKIFEYAATGKPILAGVSGYSREFLINNVDNAAVFDPCDVDGFVSAINDLSPKMIKRQQFIDQYNRKSVNRKMVENIIRCVS